MKNNFNRSNVNESTLQITDPLRSSFDLSHAQDLTLKLGVLTPVNFERLIGTDIIKGGLKPELQLEIADTPTIGRVRLDTHTFVVNMRRIHNGFRQFIEDDTNNSVLPAFDVPTLALQYICLINSSPTVDGSVADDLSILFNSQQQPSATSTVPQIAVKILNTFVQSLDLHIRNGGSHYGYMKDFLAIEKRRITAIIPSIPADESAIGFALLQILEPLFGEGSMLDHLGYPIFRRDSSWYKVLTDSNLVNAYTKSLFAPTALANTKLITLLRAYGVSQNPTAFKTLDEDLYSEMPIRACYAVYYDYFRDWHVEPRKEILDPDLFSGLPLLSSTLSAAAASRVSDIARFLQLIVLRSRYYARDFLTTVQTDDIYRHVYVPVFTETSDVSSGSPVQNGIYNASADLPYGSGSTTDTVGALTNILFNSSHGVPFLSDIFYSDSSVIGTPSQGLIADLQTMRRSGMLEKWLARNYFFPDTYVGRMNARYGVLPEDVNVLVSQIIGGNEQFVTGKQEVANMTNEYTDAGKRTVVSGVNLSDSFTYRSSDHCYVISFASLMPLVIYDIKNPHLKELRLMDIPAPEMAQDSRVCVRTKDLLRGFDYRNEILGYVPRYYHYRVRGDEAHGRYLGDYRSYTWLRDWFNMAFVELSQQLNNVNPDSHGFALTPYSLRVHLVPEAFNSKQMWDDIAFGSCDVEFYANRPLPAAVDII